MSTDTLRPLIEAVRTLESNTLRNISNQQPVLMRATSSSRSLRHDLLPSSIRTTPHKTHGPRLKEARSRDICMTAAHWPQDHLVETRYSILCGVLNGKATLPMGQYRLEVPAENFVFIPPEIPHPDGSQPHLKNSSDDQSCDLLWLYRWEGGLICHICHSHGVRHYNFDASENCFLTGEQSIYYFDMLALELETATSLPSKSAAALNTAHYILLALLATVQQDIETGNYIPSATADEAHPLSAFGTSVSAIDNYGTILSVHNYMRFHIDQTLSIDDMARYAAMSRAQFTRQFRQISGCSFLEYLTKVRLERAKQFLRETNLPVPAIARAVGLRASQLRNLFSRHLHSTPHEFRTQQAQTKKSLLPKKQSIGKSPSSQN